MTKKRVKPAEIGATFLLIDDDGEYKFGNNKDALLNEATEDLQYNAYERFKVAIYRLESLYDWVPPRPEDGKLVER